MTAALTGGLRGVLAEVVAERARQDAKWGCQRHPDVDRVVAGMPGHLAPRYAAQFYGIPTAQAAQAETDAAARAGHCSWAHIAIEELAEAIEAAALRDEAAVRTEVLQLVAVGVQWLQAIDRRAADRRSRS